MKDIAWTRSDEMGAAKVCQVIATILAVIIAGMTGSILGELLLERKMPEPSRFRELARVICVFGIVVLLSWWLL